MSNILKSLLGICALGIILFITSAPPKKSPLRNTEIGAFKAHELPGYQQITVTGKTVFKYSARVPKLEFYNKLSGETFKLMCGCDIECRASDSYRWEVPANSKVTYLQPATRREGPFPLLRLENLENNVIINYNYERCTPK